jgi:uncharacterized protein
VEEVLGPFRSKIESITRRYAACNIRIFGSLARHAGSLESGVDFLVDFDWSRKTRSKLRSIDLAKELENLLGGCVDVVTEDSLHWFIQPRVVSEAVPL